MQTHTKRSAHELSINTFHFSFKVFGLFFFFFVLQTSYSSVDSSCSKKLRFSQRKNYCYSMSLRFFILPSHTDSANSWVDSKNPSNHHCSRCSRWFVTRHTAIDDESYGNGSIYSPWFSHCTALHSTFKLMLSKFILIYLFMVCLYGICITTINSQLKIVIILGVNSCNSNNRYGKRCNMSSHQFYCWWTSMCASTYVVEQMATLNYSPQFVLTHGIALWSFLGINNVDAILEIWTL